MGYFMGIDLGTSSVKALISDEKGTVYGLGQKEYGTEIPEIGYAQQDPELWWSRTKEAVMDAVKNAGIKGDAVAGIGFSGQMHGLVALDREGRPLGKAIIHLDQRSAAERREIIEKAGELLREELFNQPGTGMLVCSLLWIKRNCPEIYEKIAWVLPPKDYIRYRLTGEICTDHNDASAALAFSVKNREWCMELIRRLGLKTDIWPRVCTAWEQAGTVGRAAAEETGLSAGIPVMTGTGDCAAQLIGNGVAEEGIMSCNIGTASQLAVVTGKPVQEEKMRCQLWCHAVPGLWICQGGALNGGSVLSWLKNKVLRDRRPFAELDREASAVPAGCEGLLFLPYLAGERTPYQDPSARGVFFGLGMKHEQAYLVRAAMEGVLFNLMECREIFDRMDIPVRSLVASGGAARGECWRQIQADMLDMPVRTTAVQEEACLGAAILAAVGAGVYPDIEMACREMVRWNPGATEPMAENVRIYKEKQEIFRELYQSVKQIFPKL